MKHFYLFALSTVALVASCVPRGDCSPQNCDGCCDEAGECRSGDTPAACGLGGSACISCGESVCRDDGMCFVSGELDAGLDANLDADVDASLDGALDAELDGAVEDAEVDASAELDGSTDASLDGGTSDAGTDAGSDGGIPFLPRDDCSEPIEVSVPAAGLQPTRPVVDFHDGRILLTYLDTDVSRRIPRARVYEAGTWGSQATLGSTSDAPRQRLVALGPSGDAAAAFAGPPISWTRWLRDHAVGWAEVPWPSGPTNNEASAMVWLGPRALVHVWHQNARAPIFEALTSSGWAPERPLSSSTGSTVSFAVGRTSEGLAAVVWHEDGLALRGRLIDGDMLLEGEALWMEPATAVSRTSLALAPLPDGSSLVLWERRSVAAGIVMVELVQSVLRREGETLVFEAPAVRASGSGSISFADLQAVADDAGDVTVTWFDTVTSRQVRALRRVGGAWGTPVTLGSASNGMMRRMVIDRGGHVSVLVGGLGTTLSLRRIARGAIDWEAPFVVSTASTFPASDEAGLALDETDNPVAIWRTGVDPIRIVASTCR